MARIPIPDGDADELLRAFALSPRLAEGAATLSAAVYGNERLPVRLRELMRMRIAQLNQCDI